MISDILRSITLNLFNYFHMLPIEAITKTKIIYNSNSKRNDLMIFTSYLLNNLVLFKKAILPCKYLIPIIKTLYKSLLTM